jgi:HTH-type transcriptional regulator / antitoxin HigA
MLWVRIIELSTLKAFISRSPAHADAREPLMAWYRQVRGADWATPADVKRAIRSASILNDRRQQVSHRGVDQLSLSRRLCPVHRHAPAVRQDRCTNRLKVEAMDISPIKNQRDYRKVLKEIEGLMMAKRNTPEGDRLDVLVTLVEAWERKHYPMDLPDPVEAIKYHMDQNGLQPRDLIPFIGSRNRVHEVLNRRRSLTLKMIWRLHEGLGIPAESLIKVGHDQAA